MKRRFSNLLAALLLPALLVGCAGGASVKKEPVPLDLQHPLAVATDANLGVTLEWVIVRDGPGTWSNNAWWDEYLLEISNQSGQRLKIKRIEVTDSLGETQTSFADRRRLTEASEVVAGRYADYGVEVRPGMGTETMIAVGTGTFVVGGTYASIALFQAMFTGAAVSPPAIVYAGPLIIAGAIAQASENNDVQDEILERHQPVPFDMLPGESLRGSFFFPVTPSPRVVRVVYYVDGAEHALTLDTELALNGLHIPPENSDGQ